MNPYRGNNFFEFFVTLFRRLKGDLPQETLPSDEVQLLVLIGVALACSLIGIFLTLKKMTMLANSLSHTILLGIVISSVVFFSTTFEIDFKTLFLASFITALLTAFLTQVLTHQMRLQEDASIGLVFTTLFALGITAVTILTRNAHIGIEVVMGNVDALHEDDIWIVWTVTLIDGAAVLLLFKEFTITAFDGALALSLGIRSRLFGYLLMILTSMTCIGAFRAVGALLVLAFIVGPVITARLLTHRLKPLLAIACSFGVLATLLGVALSRHFLSAYNMPLSTGGIVVTLIGLLFVMSVLTFRRDKGLIMGSYG